MERLLRNASIRTKVLMVVMLVTTTALVLASGSLLAWDYFQFKNDIRQQLLTEARMVLENSTAAMSFEDRKTANETMETLAPDPHIRVGCLYRPRGGLFAEFRRRDVADPCPPAPPSWGYRFGPNLVEVVVGIDVAGRPAGRIYLASDLGAVTGRVRVQTVTAVMVLVLALGVALLLSSILQRIISHPLKAVAAIAGEVSTRHDYSLRVERTTGDELGMLVDAFNGMLEQIEVSERERTELLASERQASRLKDEFLMTLSHELRTPLNAIVGWTRILRTKVVAPEQVDDALERIERNAHAQARLIEDLLDVSRLTTGKLILDRVDVDLVALANQAIETVVPLAEARRIRIERAFDTPTARLAGDPHRLQQVVWNLLSNAIKFSAPDSRVVVRIRSAGGWCELRVQDEGIGIDPDLLPFIFEPFRQGDASITRSYGGLGLGLSIVRRIVDLHGGKIAVESAGVGLGAVFTVSLPAAVALPALPSFRPTRGRAPQPTDLPGVSIVVVDDDPDARAILAALLLSAGARVRQAAGGREALALIREAMPDVLVSDIAMPDLDGYALLRELRKEHGRSKPSATIAVTAQATPTDRELALAAGFSRHLPKPFEPSVLVDLIQSALADLPR